MLVRVAVAEGGGEEVAAGECVGRAVGALEVDAAAVHVRLPVEAALPLPEPLKAGLSEAAAEVEAEGVEDWEAVGGAVPQALKVGAPERVRGGVLLPTGDIEGAHDDALSVL